MCPKLPTFDLPPRIERPQIDLSALPIKEAEKLAKFIQARDTRILKLEAIIRAVNELAGKPPAARVGS